MFKLFFTLILCTTAFASLPVQKNYTTIIEEAQNAVVFIANEQNHFDLSFGSVPDSYYEYLRPVYEWWWPTEYFSGSGFLIDPNGYIVTNAHVIDGKSKTLVILRCPDLKVCPATIVGCDFLTDIAVLKIEKIDNKEFPYLKFGNSDDAKVGEEVIAIGSPFELERSAAKGIISAKERNRQSMAPIEGFIQIDTSTNPGNSGGPLLNLRGEVIGINNWGIVGFPGLNFAIPSYTAKHISSQLISQGKVSPGFLGLGFDLDEENAFEEFYFDRNEGARIKIILEDSPAEKGGLQANDLILALNNSPIYCVHTFRNKFYVLPSESTVRLKIKRADQILEISVKLGRYPLLEEIEQEESIGSNQSFRHSDRLNLL